MWRSSFVWFGINDEEEWEKIFQIFFSVLIEENVKDLLDEKLCWINKTFVGFSDDEFSCEFSRSTTETNVWKL